ncbi:MAG TPA: DUF2235 domain-containing protein, partial [Devosia sp.]
IYVFGFSRGAYTARSFVGLLSTCGILDRRHARRANEAVALYKRRNASDGYRSEVLRWRSECSPQICVSAEEDAWRVENVAGYTAGASPPLRVRYLGVWDTVGALGIPRYIVMADALNRMHQFHDVSLSPMVEFARHAVAIDEHKVDFEPALWENLDELNRLRDADPDRVDAPYQQMWFPGLHGSVGGGGERRGLSDQALDWIWDGARFAGLDLDASPGSHLYRLAPSHNEQLANEALGFSPVGFFLAQLPKADRTPGPKRLSEVSPIARRRWRERSENLPETRPYRPGTLGAIAQELDAVEEEDIAALGDPGTEFTVYIVRSGDTLESIAKRVYGSGKQAWIILAANRNKLLGLPGVHPGQALRLPKVGK